MPSKTMLPKYTLSELCFQIWKVGHLNRTHRQQLRAALLADFLSDQDQRLINRLLYAVRRGWLPISD